MREKLADVFKHKGEDLARILFYLDEEDKAYKDNIKRPYAPQWKTLKATVKNDDAFRALANRLSDETRIGEKDQEFRKRMNMLHETMLSHSDNPVSIKDYQKLDLARAFDHNATFMSALGGLAKAWSIIPAESKISIMESIELIVHKSTMDTVKTVTTFTDKYGGTRVMVALAAINIAYETYRSIQRWWRGEISGERCIKNVLDSSFTVVAGMGGGTAGAYYGAIVGGPPGAVLGGIAGAYVSATAMNYLSDWITQKMFGLPKEEALENAYRYLGVEMTASNAEINTAFQTLVLKLHPDRKEGSHAEFYILQLNMGIIKQARSDS